VSKPAEPLTLYEPPARRRTDYRIGLAAWTDKSMLEEGEFYPRKSMTAEERLWWYARFFDTVEVNSTFYALPSERNALLWAQRTPERFIFNVKAHALFTGHHVDARSLPESLEAMLPGTAKRNARGQIENRAFGKEARELAFSEFRTALLPLAEAGKLGYILFQLAPWVRFDDKTIRYLETLPKYLPGMELAIEFRHRSWFGDHTDETLAILAKHGLAYVSIDGPKSRLSIPAVVALTSPTAVFRLHGRNFEGYLKQVKGEAPTVAEKYGYLYNERELEEIARKAGSLNGKADRVYLQLNNNNRDWPAVNAIQLKEMLLEDWRPPDREQLVAELTERRKKSAASRAR
jgi:uncharacterized protein YecE (DUF72 family)